MTPGAGQPRSPAPFTADSPLPGPGITVLEASAGTGKTYTLTSLVVRFVAAGVPLSDILAVTFTRMATGELRERIRSRLVTVGDQLSAVDGPDAGVPPADPVAAALAASAELDLVRLRLSDAVAEFDSATIATTHGFCQMVLHELGSAGDTSPETELLEDPTDLVDEVVDDLYVRRLLLHPDVPPPFGRARARQAALLATRNPDTRLVPESGDDPRGLLGRLAGRARDEVARRLLDADAVTYDSLLFRLAEALSRPGRGETSCERLRGRYPVVLVDEFQDTDPSQWRILRAAFGTGATRLVLIGDPKQAVYAFRGADVHAYLDACREASTAYTLTGNWRSDQPLLDAIAALLDPLQFGDAGIPFRSVAAPPIRSQTGLSGGPRPTPLRFRLVDDAHRAIPMTTRRMLQKGPVVEWIAGDVASDIAALLASGARLGTGGDASTGRPLLPGDLAVLTRTNRQAIMVREALRRAGVPSALAGLDSVFASEAARAWLFLLEALLDPSSRSRVAAAALTAFLGMDAMEVATAGEDRWEGAHDRMHRWAAELARRGVASLYRLITLEEGLPARVLADEGGERLLTDLGHVAHMLHVEAGTRQLSTAALRAWLAARIRAAADEQSDVEERSRRMDSDAEAVQVLTIHRAKGLEFPVVYCPYLWDSGMEERRGTPVVFHAPDAGGARTIDVGCPTGDRVVDKAYDDHASLARLESRGEDLRVLYVALTRARHQVVVWWARTQGSRLSPLGRLLTCRHPVTGEVRGVAAKEPAGKDIRSALDAASRLAPGLVAVETAEGPVGGGPGAAVAAGIPTGPGPGGDGAPADAGLTVSVFDRSVDRAWRRSSYSSVTAAAHGDHGAHGRDGGHAVTSEPEDPGLADEPPVPVKVGPPAAAASGQRVSLLSGVEGGPRIGTFLHRLLELADFAHPDLAGELSRCFRSLAVGSGDQTPDEAAVVPGLVGALTTPLDPLLPSTSLASVRRPDRLDELRFELPVAGGDRPIGEVLTSDIAALLASYLPADGPLGSYPETLSDPLLAVEMRGYLTGSLDLVFRRPAAESVLVSGSGVAGRCRWYIADYKSNVLGPSGAPLLLGHYRRAALEEEMQRRHYPLQAILYLVALHRYLRWRVPGYDPDEDLGGVLYLFLRGMAGPDTPLADGGRTGVYTWIPPAALVVELSDLLASGGRRR